VENPEIVSLVLSQQNPKHNNKNNPWVSLKHISSEQNTKEKNKRNNLWVFHKYISSEQNTKGVLDFVEIIFVC
jgi:hypothetical protein